MAKILNLDKIAPKENRELHLGGQVYQVRDMSVEDFIETSRLAERLEDEKSFAVQMEASIQIIQRAVPTIDVAVLKQLSLEQMSAVSRFVRGEEVGADEGATEGKA